MTPQKKRRPRNKSGNMKKPLLSLIAVLAIGSAHAGWLNSLLGTGSTNAAAATNPAPATASTTTSSALAALSGLSQDQMIGGLKNALTNGLQVAITSLGHTG